MTRVLSSGDLVIERCVMYIYGRRMCSNLIEKVIHDVYQ